VRSVHTAPADYVTIANGVCGFLAVAVVGGLVLRGDAHGPGLDDDTLRLAILLYGLGQVFDVIDGPIARRTGSSGLGVALDTICDAISFGLVPAALLVAHAQGSGGAAAVVVAACVYLGATILRLAHFALLAEQSHARAATSGEPAVRGDFSGMPSPAGGNCVIALVVLGLPAAVVAPAVVLLAVLLVLDFPYPANRGIAGAYVLVMLVWVAVALALHLSLTVPAIGTIVGVVPVALFGAGRRVVGA
jgi:CDP-diacylglycerol--serine O-phosphatidyltransferase